jgi:hypothetical protein
MIENKSKEDGELQSAAKEMRNNLWTDSMWQTYQESIDVVVFDPENPEGPGQRITRKLSIGMSVKSDNRAPAKVLQYALSRSLNSLMEEEKERWLDTNDMKQEIERAKQRGKDNGGEQQATDNPGVEPTPGEGVSPDTEDGRQGEEDTSSGITG